MRRKHKHPRPAEDPAYTCPTCGESIVIPLDSSAGTDQTYTEDCPVCCHPNVIHVEFFDPPDPPRIWAESE